MRLALTKITLPSFDHSSVVMGGPLKASTHQNILHFFLVSRNGTKTHPGTPTPELTQNAIQLHANGLKTKFNCLI